MRIAHTLRVFDAEKVLAMRIPLSRPMIGKEEKEAVLRVLESGHLAQGREVECFEKEFAAYTGTQEAVATSSGTTALFVALKALGVQPGDKVVTTPFTFVATASAILHCGGIPVFCDVDHKTGNIDPERLQEVVARDPQVKGVVIVHLYGTPCALSEILAVVRSRGLFLVEDCAQAHGAEYWGKKVGSFGDVGIFSFYPTKNMTTGEGGMVVTNLPEVAERCRMLINHGSRKRYYHEILGYNFRMTDIAAAIGRVQLRRLDEQNAKRRENALFYSERLAGLRGIEIPEVPQGTLPVFHQYTVRVLERRDALLAFLRERGIGCEVYYPLPLHRQAFLESYGYGSFPVAERLSREVLSIPVHPGLSRSDLEEVVSLIREFFEGPGFVGDGA
ncbi:DegT/DnrJ/EryC1/StrS family aminotransferase [Candidatus Caldatribacterium sp.]|uniref:DegT/DnrJ/EryC1/StrS family aminotransferase n=1 Tax=Candidatus Caldatribacterium sp. TaxID=2282143 RepID=UPI00299558B2|nr:DegT/DnrJ/EryC1/StrS family aminotransferase [Candidatus Calescibacterium sp.]